MKLKPGALEWLKGRYIIHQGDNGRNGAVFMLDDIVSKFHSGKTKLLRTIPLEDYWPERQGNMPQ